MTHRPVSNMMVRVQASDGWQSRINESLFEMGGEGYSIMSVVQDPHTGSFYLFYARPARAVGIKQRQEG